MGGQRLPSGVQYLGGREDCESIPKYYVIDLAIFAPDKWKNAMDLPPENSNFNHPYSPYDIQLQFMRALYTSLEEGKVAVFESPTG